MRLIDTRCPGCSTVVIDVLLRGAESLPACAQCGAQTERVYLPGGLPAVHDDSIPGGVLIKNAICNPDGTPRRYYSHTEIRQEAARRGWTPHVEHIPKRGSDKSPHTTRWV